MIFFCLPCTAYAQELPEKLHNLVLFINFPEDEGNFMDGKTEEIDKMCNQADTCRSLDGYIRQISYGKMQVESHFPQLEQGKIKPCTLSKNPESYVDCQAAAAEVLESLTIPEEIPLDGNHDGIIDNIMMIFCGENNSAYALTQPCAFSLSGYSINGKNSGMVNVHNSRDIFGNLISGGAGVICHEFLHSIGYPDLYRQGTESGVPVGLWDIMAANSVFVQYPLAYLRSSVSGWLETENITQSGHYTLSPASSSEGNRCYLLKTPLSDTEFFAVEYRQAGKPYSEEMDVKIYGSGMVVYRVNTEVIGNHNQNQDEIYVFRPEETELNAGKGDLYHSCYGGENAPDFIGSAEKNAGVADEALVYSDGTNSGIVLKNITLTPENLTFDAEFPEINNTELWQNVNDLPEGNFRSVDMISSEGNIFLAAEDGKNIIFFRVTPEGITQEAVYTPSGGVNEIKLAAKGKEIYFLYQNNEYSAVLGTYQNGNCELLWESETLAQYTEIAASEERAGFLFTTGDYPNYILHAAEISGKQMIEFPESISESACSPAISVVNGKFAVAYREISSGDLPMFATEENGKFSAQKLSDLPCSAVSAASDGESVCITVTGEAENIYHYTGKELFSENMPKLSGKCFSAVPESSQQYILYNTQKENDLAVYDAHGEKCGNSLDDSIVNTPALVRNQDFLYAAYLTNQGKLSLKFLKINETNAFVSGDVNADGAFTLADAIAMQKYLLSAEPLENVSAGDVYQDKILNIYDFLMMKIKLFSNK